MITSELRAPAMGAFRLLSLKQVDELGYEGGLETAQTLKQMDMGIFEDPRGYYWVGAKAPDFPDHLRWFHVLEQRELQRRRSWRTIEFRDVNYHQPNLSAEDDEDQDVPNNLLVEAEYIHTTLQDQILQVAVNAEHEQQLMTTGLCIWQTLGYGALIDDPKLWQLPWDSDTHDLMMHYERFKVRNPAFTDCPHQLALRIHGLAYHADQLAGLQGFPEWISQQRCDLT